MIPALDFSDETFSKIEAQTFHAPSAATPADAAPDAASTRSHREPERPGPSRPAPASEQVGAHAPSPPLDFSDEAFSRLEARAFHGAPVAAPPPDDEAMSIPDAARILGESRQTTWRRTKAGQLEEITVNGRAFVRRADVMALLDAGKPSAQRAERSSSFAAGVASGRARATSQAVSDQLADLASAVTALQSEVRSVHTTLRALLLTRGGGR